MWNFMTNIKKEERNSNKAEVLQSMAAVRRGLRRRDTHGHKQRRWNSSSVKGCT